MATSKRLRTNVSDAGSYVSLPEAFEEAHEAVKLAPKIHLRTERFVDSKHPLGIDYVMNPHHLLMDLEAVDAEAFDARTLINDCEIVKNVAQKSPEKLKAILASFAEDAPHDRILEAARTASDLGLSEDKASRKGGGLLWLLVIVAAVALSGCKGCAHTKGSMRQ
jgi:hypothetical protein